MPNQLEDIPDFDWNEMNEWLNRQRLVFERPRRVQVIDHWPEMPQLNAGDQPRFWPYGERQPAGKRGEELFNLILDGLKEVFPDKKAVIAGGAVRDFVAGDPWYKSMSLFLDMTVDEFKFGAEELGWQGKFVQVGKSDYSNEKCAIPSTARGSHMVQGCPIDLVFIKGPLDIRKFPIHAQRFAYGQGVGLIAMPEATEDVQKKQFTIDPTITDKRKIASLVTKIKGWQKRPIYKDWKIVEPPREEWWEKE